MKQRLPKKYALALYRITQEFINNVLKHAEAKNVSLQIGQRDEKIILTIEDDGNGFDVAVHKDGYGVQNLEAHTNLMQGTIYTDENLNCRLILSFVSIQLTFHTPKGVYENSPFQGIVWLALIPQL